LEQRWKNINACLEKLMGELRLALKQLGLSNKTSLTDLESVFVAIVYNAGFGNFRKSRGLKQGHKDDGRFYGENIDRFLRIARTIPTPAPAVIPRVSGAPTVAPAVTPRVSGAPAVAPVPARPTVMAIAKAEFDRFHGIDEGKQPLRGGIAGYYEAAGGSRNLDPTRDDNAWSAAFVSFCVKESGATLDQFKFNLSHSVFVNAAIANADANRGVFRGHRISEYGPNLGGSRRGVGTANFTLAPHPTAGPARRHRSLAH